MGFRSLGSCEPCSTDKQGRRDRHTASLDSAGPIRSPSPCGPGSTDLQLPEAPPATLRRLRPCTERIERSGTNVRRKVLARKSTSPSRRQPKPSSDFTLRHCQAFGPPAFRQTIANKQNPV